jgi:hypothetical protein
MGGTIGSQRRATRRVFEGRQLWAGGGRAAHRAGQRGRASPGRDRVGRDNTPGANSLGRVSRPEAKEARAGTVSDRPVTAAGGSRSPGRAGPGRAGPIPVEEAPRHHQARRSRRGSVRPVRARVAAHSELVQLYRSKATRFPRASSPPTSLTTHLPLPCPQSPHLRLRPPRLLPPSLGSRPLDGRCTRPE